MLPESHRFVLLVALASGACVPRTTRPPGDAPTNATAIEGEPAGTTIVRGPARIAIDGDPNGLLWHGRTLFIADGDHDRILTWTDREGVRKLHELARDGKPGGIGQIARRSDGMLFVTRFGGGESGGIVSIAPDGTIADLPGLDPKRRRIGLATAPDGTVYTAYFEAHGDTRVGTVAMIDPTGTEVAVLQHLQKPVGLAVVADALFVADQRKNEILRAPLSDLAHPVALASVAEPDLLCAGPDGALLTGGKNGEVRRIDPDGRVSVVADGFASVRGVAFDDVNDRIFVAEHDTKDDDGLDHAIHVRSLDTAP